MVWNNCYKVLGVGRDASSNDIKHAYRRLVRRWHPDLNPALPDAQERLRRLIEAYQVLRDASSRARYDRMLDLFCTPRRAQGGWPTTPRTVAERRSGSIRPMFATAVLAGLILFVGLSHRDARPVPLEWQDRAASSVALGLATLACSEVDANYQWVVSFWQRQLQITPSSRFAAFNLAAAYTDMARSAARRGDLSLAREYQRTAQSVSPEAIFARTQFPGDAKS